MHEDIKISIIIPVYNSERYLKECLESVVNQVIDKKQIIIINDGSTDRSREIIKFYEELYDDIIVIDKKNEGVAIARNTALDIAKGKYIAFVDSDDIIEKNMFDKMIKISDEMKLDIIECAYSNLYDDNEEKVNIFDSPSRSILKEDKEIIKYFLNFKSKGYLWNKIYRKEIIDKNAIKFPEVRYFEDMLFNIKVYLNAKRFCAINENLYKYRVLDDSLTTNIKEEHAISYFHQSKIWFDYLSKIEDFDLEKDILKFKVNITLINDSWFNICGVNKLKFKDRYNYDFVNINKMLFLKDIKLKSKLKYLSIYLKSQLKIN